MNFLKKNYKLNNINRYKLGKKMKFIVGISVLIITGFFMVAADHIDAPDVAGGTSDIADYYVFQGQNSDNLVLAVTVQGLMSPTATTNASFDENILIEFNIDTTGDNVEDLVIQAIPRNSKMYFFGPTTPSATGLNSAIATTAITSVVDITPYGSNAIVNSNSGMSFFAGSRDDPFFFDSAQYSEIIAGNATSFNNPGNDTFAGTNVLSIVIEVPKTMIGGSGTINTWIESKRKQ